MLSFSLKVLSRILLFVSFCQDNILIISMKYGLKQEFIVLSQENNYDSLCNVMLVFFIVMGRICM